MVDERGQRAHHGRMPKTNEMVVEKHAERLAVEQCSDCQVLFGVPEGLLKARRTQGGHLWCPNGHVLAYGAVMALVAPRVTHARPRPDNTNSRRTKGSTR